MSLTGSFTGIETGMPSAADGSTALVFVWLSSCLAHIRALLFGAWLEFLAYQQWEQPQFLWCGAPWLVRGELRSASGLVCRLDPGGGPASAQSAGQRRVASLHWRCVFLAMCFVKHDVLVARPRLSA
mmetsp:Transcript_21016/g.47102  ORF Transcript_21016/g.47102 Transcript_21016/m.47102 type:complete len:127 (+) Transcript_21016:819-1199(+)